MQSTTESPPRWSRRRAASFVFPLLLVVVGVVLLLNNLGIVPWTIWTALGQLWPVILILFGIDLLLGRRSAWLGASVAAIVLIAILGTALWMTYNRVGFEATTAVSPQQSASVPVDGVTSGQVDVRFGAGILHVGSPPANSSNFAEASGALPPGVELSRSGSTRQGVANVTFSTEGAATFWPFRGINQGQHDMSLDVLLATKIPLTLRADVGAGQSTFDLSDLQASSFTLNNGAGQATVLFPANAGQTTADIHSGAGQLILNIPDSVDTTIKADNGLVNLRVPPGRFQKVGDTYQSLNTSKATNHLNLTLHVGFGEVDVQ